MMGFSIDTIIQLKTRAREFLGLATLASALFILSACNGTTADQVVGVDSIPTPAPTATPGRAILVTGISSATFPNTSVNATSTINVTVYNSGTSAAQLGAVTFLGTDASIVSDSCSATVLGVGSFCDLVLNFSPLTVETVNEVLTVPYTGGGTYTLIKTFSGASTVPNPAIISSPAAYDFGTIQIGSNGTHSFVVSNSDTGPATFQASSVSGTGFSITTDTCTGVTNMITGGSTCTVTVKFLPTTPGIILSTLTLNYHNSSGTAFTQTVSLSAIGASPQPTLTLSPNPYNFSNVPTGTGATQTITVSNASLANATLGTLSISGAGFTISSQTCSSTVLVPGAACQAIVRFAPSSTGAVSGTFSVPYTAADGTSYTGTDTLGGTGTTPSTSFTFAGVTGSSNLTATGVTALWSAQTLAAYYVVRWTTGGTTLTSAHLAPTSLTSYNITGLAANTTYTLQVNAYDSNDNSDGNVATVSITTPNVTGATFNGWSDVVALGNVYTDIGTVDTASGNTGANRWEQNLGSVAGFNNTAINTTNGQITANTTFVTGTSVKFNTDGSAPTGLTIGTTYYVININATTMELASTSANAFASTPIIPSTIGSGNMTLMPNAVVKLGWELFTFTPSGSATTYNIYRDTSPGFGTAILIGSSSTVSYSDWTPASQTTYYYKIKPVISGVEVNPTVVTDSIIQVYVPPANMALLHRWIVNREACTTLIGLTFPSGVNRNTNYSCSYAWGGSGSSLYGVNSVNDKTKWDLGYSLVVDRWQSGCKMKTYGSAVPSGGSTNDVYLKTGGGSSSFSSLGSCYIKDSVGGWTTETGTLTNASRGLIRTNYPGYSSTGAYQSQTYTSCQQRSYTGVADGNGNTALRLMRLHEAVLARAVQGVNVNKRSAITLSNIFNGNTLPTYLSCNVPLNNQVGASLLTGVTIPNPSTYSLNGYELMNGSYLSSNCYSRYEIANLWDQVWESLSDQYYGPSASGGYFVASTLDPANNLLEGYLMNGTVGPSQTFSGFTNNTFFGTTNNQPLLPIFGVRAVSVDSSLGSITPTMSNLDYGATSNANYTYISYGGAATNAIVIGSLGAAYYNSSRYEFAHNAFNSASSEWNTSASPVSSRCSGEVGP
jgi:hypothetical protein